MLLLVQTWIPATTGVTCLWPRVKIPRVLDKILHPSSLLSTSTISSVEREQIIAILIDVEWYFTKVLICSFLLGSDLEHLFMFIGHSFIEMSI